MQMLTLLLSMDILRKVVQTFFLVISPDDLYIVSFIITLIIASLVSLSFVAHDCCEVVLVTLCSFSPGVLKAPEDHRACLGHVNPLAEHRFSFVQDLAFDMAQFLVSKLL